MKMKYGQAFSDIERLADSVLNAESFYKLGPFSERHGCWEIIYHHGPGAHAGPAGGSEQLEGRYVTISLLRMASMTEPGAWSEIEVWAGAEAGAEEGIHAENGPKMPVRRIRMPGQLRKAVEPESPNPNHFPFRYTRRLVSQFQTSERKFGTEAFRAMTKESLRRAAKVALELRLSDLTETYPRLRSARLG